MKEKWQIKMWATLGEILGKDGPTVVNEAGRADDDDAAQASGGPRGARGRPQARRDWTPRRAALDR